MAIFTITQKEAEVLQGFFPEDILDNIGKENVHTLGVLDDEEFISGVLQFFVGFDKNIGTYSRIYYLYVPEDFVGEDTTASLLWEYESILKESDVREDLMDMVDDTCVFLYSDTAENISRLKSMQSLKEKDIYSISFIDNMEFIKIKKKLASAFELEQKKCYEDEISSFYRSKDSYGLLLVKKDALNDLNISYIGADSEDSKAKLGALLAYSTKRAVDQYGADQNMRIECKDYNALSLYSRIIPEILPPDLSEE